MTNGSRELWITYAWDDDEEGDFSYLVQELVSVGVKASYDKVRVIPGRRLWEQIADHITGGPYDGWAYLLTANSVESEACREELAYALDRALRANGRDFPLIGLLHSVPMEEVPPALRVRLCVSLANPEWKEEIIAGLEGRPPRRVRSSQGDRICRIHSNYRGDSRLTAIEIRPRFSQVLNWRIGIPSSAGPPRDWGLGPAGGGPITGHKTWFVEGSTTIDDAKVQVFGAMDALSPSISAYVVFEGELPSRIFFGAAERDLVPAAWDAIEIRG